MSHLLAHRHFIFRAIGANALGAGDVEKVNQWVLDLVRKIDMEILIAPQTVYCALKGNEGITSIAAITTSSITLHMWECSKEIQLDIYSCKTFDIDIVFKHIEELVGKYSQADFICLNRDKILDIQHDCL